MISSEGQTEVLTFVQYFHVHTNYTCSRYSFWENYFIHMLCSWPNRNISHNFVLCLIPKLTLAKNTAVIELVLQSIGAVIDR